ncbi:MerR family transcriptional regulator [Micromonospora sp. SH-82]|uniref:DNA polymerase III subunit beta family protein n=1 Tax=Micromonospora sp. SH-82 TaxID=3132938 RepID=UPI003EBDBC58
MHSIGEFARLSGLSVSALRFYDRSAVLAPARVDPVTGYRWYTREQVWPARLVAGLRRVGMPLAEITAVLDHRYDPPAARRLLDAHLHRLEAGLTDARRELSRVCDLLEPPPATTTRLALRPLDLAAALDAVRFAVGTDPDLPMLGVVLFDVEPDGVRLVATDRHRMAFGRARGQVTGPPARIPVPVAAVDALRVLLTTGTAENTVEVEVGGGALTARLTGGEVRAEALAYDFPDYHRLLRRTVDDRPVRRVPVDGSALAVALRAAPTVTREHAGVTHRVTVLGLDDRAGVRPLGVDELTVSGVDLRVGVNGGYLLDALDAADSPRLVLELDGPIGPLAVRRVEDPDVFSILMPIRL